MSWAVKVTLSSGEVPPLNGMRFATAAEAEGEASELMMRWFQVHHWQVVEAEHDPVTYRRESGRTERV